MRLVTIVTLSNDWRVSPRALGPISMCLNANQSCFVGGDLLKGQITRPLYKLYICLWVFARRDTSLLNNE